MKFETLYLHVGWSKTGTSAIQAQVNAQKDDFLAKGIIYPETLQWADHSHHPFALSFQPSGSYKSDMTPADALAKLALEMEAVTAQNVLMSSELSPFYFDNPKFKEFVRKKFENVKVIFTVRRQSELLLSLFNQLVKDPNVRYNASIFTLAMRNLSWLNFYQNVKRWHDVVGQENIIVLPYGKDIVDRFMGVFDIECKKAAGPDDAVVNPSLPTRVLSLVQAKGRLATDNADFIRTRDGIVTSAREIPSEMDRYVLFSIPEQQAVDQHYHHGNRLLAEMTGFDPQVLNRADYKPVKTLPPGYKI